ncbi:MAG: tetratricopeptide repeat protein, partial [Chloroflexi bacterium]
FYTGLRSLGWISTARSRNLWLGLTLAGILLGAAVPRVSTGNWTFAGVGVAMGLLASLGIYLIGCLVWGAGDSTLTDRAALTAGILAALVGHLAEISVGIRVTATESVFWVLAGLLVVLSTRFEDETAPAASPAPRLEPEGITLAWHPEPAALGILGGLMLSTLSFGIFLLPGANVPVSGIGRWVLLIGTWVLTGPLWLSVPDAHSRPGTGWIYPLVSLVWAGLFLGLRSLVPLMGGDALTLLNVYFVWLLLSVALIAIMLPRRPAPAVTSQAWLAVVYPVLGAIALGLVVWLAVKPLYADIYLEAAQANATAGQWSAALAFFQQAADESPEVDVYQQNLGEALVTAARLTPDPNQRQALLQTGRQAFQRAVELNPAEGTHRFNLAHLYLLWAQATPDPAQRASLLSQAADLYAQVASQTPRDPRVLTEWGRVLQEQGDTEGALAKYRTALELDPRDAQVYLQIGSLYQRSGKMDQALQMFQKVIELEPRRVEGYRALADLYREEGRLLDALKAQQQAAALQPTDYTIHQNLALLYRDLGQIENAVAEARLALNYAPPAQQQALQSFIQSLLAASTP